MLIVNPYIVFHFFVWIYVVMFLEFYILGFWIKGEKENNNLFFFMLICLYVSIYFFKCLCYLVLLLLCRCAVSVYHSCRGKFNTMTSDLYHMFIYVLCVGKKRKGGTRIQKHLIRISKNNVALYLFNNNLALYSWLKCIHTLIADNSTLNIFMKALTVYFP